MLIFYAGCRILRVSELELATRALFRGNRFPDLR